jgi:hypothetical protein
VALAQRPPAQLPEQQEAFVKQRAPLGLQPGLPQTPALQVRPAQQAWPPVQGWPPPLQVEEAQTPPEQMPEQQPALFAQDPPLGVQVTKSTDTLPRPAWRICSAICTTTPEVISTVTGSLSHVGSVLAPGGQLANASPLMVTIPSGKPPISVMNDIAPGVTGTVCTVVSAGPFAVMRRQLTSMGTVLIASAIRPMGASRPSRISLQPAGASVVASMAAKTTAPPRRQPGSTDFTVSTVRAFM